MAVNIEACEAIIGHKFASPAFLEEALTHASVKGKAGKSNERLEFLGDSVVNLVISEHLYTANADKTEGELTEIKSHLVSRRVLGRAGRRLGIENVASIGKGVSAQKRIPVSISANLYESVVAAIYLDGGLAPAREFVLRSLKEELDTITHFRDYKSLLQQLAQRLWDVVPTYTVVGETGPPHQKSFRVAAAINGVVYGEGVGPTKKEAEQAAALRTLESLNYGRDTRPDSR